MLTGIAPAPRGIPQIEVTFDVDANGIVHVEAKDLGTGKSTDITITSSTNLSEDEINKAVKEAEQYAEEDKKRKQKVDSRNKLDGLIFSVEQTLKENGDKFSDEEKATLNSAVEEAKKELDADDEERFNAAFESSRRCISRTRQTAAARRTASLRRVTKSSTSKARGAFRKA